MARRAVNGVSLKVRVQPKAAGNQVAGYRGDTLRLRVAAPPEAGKANAAVVSLLAQALGIAKSRIWIVRGHASRDKVVMVESLTPEEVQQRLNAPAEGRHLPGQSVGVRRAGRPMPIKPKLHSAE
jgi:uncharacterized protein (TIGR00251 family)